MPWTPLSDALTKRLTQHHLMPSITAGVICQKAESFQPGLFKAVSVRQGVLHILVSPQNMIQFKLQEGQILRALNDWLKSQKMEPLKQIRLTMAS